MKKLVFWEINVDNETFDLFMQSFRKSGFKTKLDFLMAMVKKYSKSQTTEIKKTEIEEVFEGLKNDPPQFEEIKAKDSEEFEPQEGDVINHENGKTYIFTNGSWLPEHKEI